MKRLFTLIFTALLVLGIQSAEAARDLKAELAAIEQEKARVQKVQQSLSAELGEVGKSLKALDEELLIARIEYRKVRKSIQAVDTLLKELTEEKKVLKKRIDKLYEQMIQEAKAAYRNSGTRSIWVDMLSDTSITEIPHRQFLLKKIMASQEEDREAWRSAMEDLANIEKKEEANKTQLLALQKERKEAERILVKKVAAKKAAAKALRSDLAKSKEQEERLKQQQIALQRLLNGLGDSLRGSEKRSRSASVRQKKGKLDWPLKGRVVVGFGQSTSAGKKLAGVHLSPQRRTEEGKLVHALGEGQVRYADWFGGYGLMMIVDYGNGIMAVYAHNDALHKQLGDWVEQDEVLAEAGSTGWIEDTRLYFEVRDKGKPVDPKLWCKK